VRFERLSRDDLTHLDATRPARKVYRDPPDLPVHHGGWTSPAPCGLPPGAWAARTNVAAYVTCTGCRPRPVVMVPQTRPGGLPGPAPVMLLSVG
jgi:hypothetical protein